MPAGLLAHRLCQFLDATRVGIADHHLGTFLYKPARYRLPDSCARCGCHNSHLSV
jgi:hypothetical protein